MDRSKIGLFTLLMAISVPAAAHHSVLHYDGKTEIKISGIVTAAKFGFPHSVYKIEVSGADGSVEEWILSTEDPRDAERLGFRDEIKAIKLFLEFQPVFQSAMIIPQMQGTGRLHTTYYSFFIHSVFLRATPGGN